MSTASGEGPGSFQLEAKDPTGGKTPVPICGSTAPNSFVAPEFTDGSGSSFINIQEIDKTWDASLIVDQSATGTLFDLTSELSSPRGAIVGSANIVLGGHSEHHEYGVGVTIEDSYKRSGDDSLNLKHEAIVSYTPCTLFLAGEEISNGEPFIWPNLGFAPIINQKNLIVKVNYSGTLSKIAGKYSDTIYVTIAPHETNPFTF